MNIIFQPGAPTIRGPDALEDFSLSAIENYSVVNGSTSSSVSGDANLTTVTGAQVTENFYVRASGFGLTGDPTFVSQTPTIAGVGVDGLVTWVSNGEAVIDVKTNLGTRRLVRNIYQLQTGSTSFDSWATGSLAKHIVDSIDGYINGKTPTADNSNLRVDGVLNPDIFTGSLNLRAMSTWAGPNVCLISPWHFIGSHLLSTCRIGQKVYFEAPGGATIERTVTGILPFTSNGRGTDQHFVGALDAAINEIAPFKLLPADFAYKLPNNTSTAVSTVDYTLPVLRRKQAGGDKIELLGARIYNKNALDSLSLTHYFPDAYNPWMTAIISGDSNGAIFIPVNGESVLLSSMNHSAGSRNYAYHAAEIQSLMTTLHAGETLQQVDLSGFTSY